MKKTTKHVPEYQTCDYLKYYLDPVAAKNRYVLAAKVLKKYAKEFDSIAFTGMSGALIAPAIASRLNKPLIMVRKSTRNCHSSHKVEGNKACKKYVIVDDLISSGETATNIQKAIHKFAPDARCIGVLQVNELSNSLDNKLTTSGAGSMLEILDFN